MKTKNMILILAILFLLTINACIDDKKNDTNTVDNNVIDENNQIDNNIITDKNNLMKPNVKIELNKEKYEIVEEIEGKIINYSKTPIYFAQFESLAGISFFDGESWVNLSQSDFTRYFCDNNKLIVTMSSSKNNEENKVNFTAPRKYTCSTVSENSIPFNWNQTYYKQVYDKCEGEDYYWMEEVHVNKGLYKINFCYFLNEETCSIAYEIANKEELERKQKEIHCLEKEFEIV